MKLLIGDKEANKYLGLEGDILYIVTVDPNNSDSIISKVKVGSVGNSATDTSSGLMSSEDKKKLDSLSSSIQSSSNSSTIQGSTTISKDSSSSKFSSTNEDKSSNSHSSSSSSSSSTDTYTNASSDGTNSTLDDNTDQFGTSISLSVNGTSNLIKNSSFLNTFSNWVTSNGNPSITLFDSIPGTRATSALYSKYGSRDKLLQEVSLNAGTYNLSLLSNIVNVGSDFNWSGISLYLNDDLINQTGSNSVTDSFKKESTSFKVDTSGVFRLEVFSDANNECYLSSLMIDNKNLTEWEPNLDDKSKTTLKFNKSGLSIIDNVGTFSITNQGISRTNTTDNKSNTVFDINDNLSMMRNLQIVNNLSLGNTKLVPVSGQNANGIAFM